MGEAAAGYWKQSKSRLEQAETFLTVVESNGLTNWGAVGVLP